MTTTNSPAMDKILALAREMAAKTPTANGRRKTPKACSCGCGGMTRGGDWLPGHDAKALSAALAAERAKLAAARTAPGTAQGAEA